MTNTTFQASSLSLGPALEGEAGSSTGSRVLQTIDAGHNQMSQQFADYYARNRSFLERIFPTKLDRILRDGQLALAKSDQEINLRLHDLMCEAKYAAVLESAECWVKTLKVETRQRFIQFITVHKTELRQTIEEHRVKFADHIMARYATAEKYHAIPALYGRYLKSVQDEIEADFGWLDGLLTKFSAIVDEGLQTYSKPLLPKSH
jgi:hypothetical protein